MSAKHQIDIYTMMMILSFIFMLLACIFMGIEASRHDGTPAPRVFLESITSSSRIG